MRRQWTKPAVFALLLAVSLLSVAGPASAVGSGQACKKAGLTATSKSGKKTTYLLCAKVGKKLLWVNTKPPATTTTTTTTTVVPTTTTTIASTTTVAGTCAMGGTCVVGDTGPGGGIVFYVATSPFTAAGATCRIGGCKYLEAAPSGWSVTPNSGCARAGTSSMDPRCVWSGNTDSVIGATANSTGIGAGFSNTAAIVGQASGGDTAGRAATASQAYRGGSKTDWFLPSKDELNEMYVNRNVVGGLADNFYMSSSEYSFQLWTQLFSNWGLKNINPKFSNYYVRPIRVF